MAAGALRIIACVLAVAVAAWPNDAAASEAKIGVGIHVPGAPARIGPLDAHVRAVGHRPAIVSWYRYWSDPLIFEANLLRVLRRGAIPLITWEPWGPDRTGFDLDEIASGRYDAYIRTSARDAAKWGRPILLRFAHEMNGDWYPWGAGVDGNTPGDYRRAWRHVVSIFRASGAGNVRFVWCPNTENDSTTPMRPFYPGDRWIDWAGLDGFNWGGPWGWRSFSEIFAPSYERLVGLTPAPVVIAETGSNDHPGDKPAWIASAYEQELPRFTQVRAVVWFDDTFADRADFRLRSSPAALAAYTQAIASPRYRVDGRGVLMAERRAGRSARSAPEVPVPDSGFGRPSLIERAREELRGKEAPLFAGLAAVFTFSAVVVWMHRRRARRLR